MDVLEFLKFSVLEEHKSLSKLLDKMDEDTLNVELGGDDKSIDTIGKRLRHISEAEYRMAGYLYTKPGEEEFKIEEISLSSLRSAFDRSKERHLETIENLNPEDLDRDWISPRSGRTFTYKWLLYHFIEHITMHRGQVAMATRQG